ncbi:ClpP/crotonase [Massarina eburnea CBS 473.64]|uniref:ClpP/crotonase n=1 Tax=Massarina eburnea CBS 473.64 TaxID=1395130 RepID=A0A6A6S2T6_9PLEO|nr:ClpP/crotonase [Massarina eburnea CBS 473.64]
MRLPGLLFVLSLATGILAQYTNSTNCTSSNPNPIDSSPNSSCPTTNCSSIVITKVTPSYWRATFSSPPFNIQNTAWYTCFYDIITKIAASPDVKVVVWDAVPEAPFWIAHYDIINGVAPEVISGWWANVTKLANLPVLNVAAIRGIARGGGAELAAALDVRFASKEKGKLGQIEVAVGGMPGGGGMELIPRLVNRGRALEIILGADDLDAETAALYGWINRAIPDAQFVSFVDAFARRVSSYDAYAIKHAKEMINKRTGFPTVEEQRESEEAFDTAASQGVVAQRIGALVEAGLQTNLDFELDITENLLEYQGNGPWPSTDDQERK